MAETDLYKGNSLIWHLAINLTITSFAYTCNMKTILFILALASVSPLLVYGQKSKSFSGVLTYHVESLNSKDSVKEKVIIYAKDSLLRIVNFNTQTGKQEFIKHLTYNKSYILVETPLQKFAVRTREHMEKDSVTYTFERRKGHKRIGGLKSKELLVKYEENKLPLTCYYYKRIDSKYANSMKSFPGLATLFYSFSDRGILRYRLEKIEKNNPPLALFQIPLDYKIVTLEEFSIEFDKLYNKD